MKLTESTLRKIVRKMINEEVETTPPPKVSYEGEKLTAEQVVSIIENFESVDDDDPYDRPDFSGANLSGIDLSDVKFPGNSKLDGVKAIGTNFTNADLYGCSAEGANFTKANFTNCDLGGAWMKDATLTGAIFDKANLEDANIDGAKL